MAGVNYSINVASGNTLIYGGRFGQPSLIANLQPGYWIEAPNTNMSAVYEPIETRLAGDPATVMTAWSGGAWDVANKRLWVFGGGHLDYKGNENYAFDAVTLTWQRIRNSSLDYTNCSEFAADGAPAATHSYNGLLYVPNIQKVMKFGGGSYGSSCPSYLHLLTQDTVSGAWVEYNDMTSPNGSHHQAAIAYDSATGLVWREPGFIGGPFLFETWNPITDVWTTQRTNLSGLDWDSGSAIDPDRRLFVIVGGNQNYMRVWDLDSPSTPPTSPTTSGPTTIETTSGPGFIFDPVVKKFVGWAGGTGIYVLDPVTWTWTFHAADAGNTVTPSTFTPNGVYGRFFYDPDWDVYGVVNSTTTNVFFFRRPSTVT